MKVIISGGGTGGHVFPAIAIADELKKRTPEIQIHFVGAEGKIEMQKVPQAGYTITGLPIIGFSRTFSISYFKLPLYILSSLYKSYSLLKSFKPDVVVGVGGYASGPVLRVAAWLNIPVLIQEQNSYPGITNKMLSKSASTICVAFEGLENYFEASKIVNTGNPVRAGLLRQQDKALSRMHFGLDKSKFTICVMGGSLGAEAINKAMLKSLTKIIAEKEIQWIWQCGTRYYQDTKWHIEQEENPICLLPFIDRMDMAYSASDLVICRAGALTLAELCISQSPCILIPSPNVAEDHQRKNAEALENQKAAIMLLEEKLEESFWSTVQALKSDANLRNEMKIQLKRLAKPDAAASIASEIFKLITHGRKE